MTDIEDIMNRKQPMEVVEVETVAATSSRDFVSQVLRDAVQYLRNPENFGFDLSIAAEEKRIIMLGKVNQALATNLSRGK